VPDVARPPGDRGRRGDGRPAVVPHLRVADHPEPGPARGRDRDHLAAVRAGHVPPRRAGSSRHQGRSRTADGPRPRDRSRGRRLRAWPACACSPRPPRHSAPTSHARARGDSAAGSSRPTA
jgi:hypothetical protein